MASFGDQNPQIQKGKKANRNPYIRETGENGKRHLQQKKRI